MINSSKPPVNGNNHKFGSNRRIKRSKSKNLHEFSFIFLSISHRQLVRRSLFYWRETNLYFGQLPAVPEFIHQSKIFSCLLFSWWNPCKKSNQFWYDFFNWLLVKNIQPMSHDRPRMFRPTIDGAMILFKNKLRLLDLCIWFANLLIIKKIFDDIIKL